MLWTLKTSGPPVSRRTIASAMESSPPARRVGLGRSDVALRGRAIRRPLHHRLDNGGRASGRVQGSGAVTGKEKRMLPKPEIELTPDGFVKWWK